MVRTSYKVKFNVNLTAFGLGTGLRSRQVPGGGGFSVARATSVAGGFAGNIPEENPNSMMIRETQSQAQHAEFNIARERELEK